jgi:hypothetical protein
VAVAPDDPRLGPGSINPFLPGGAYGPRLAPPQPAPTYQPFGGTPAGAALTGGPMGGGVAPAPVPVDPGNVEEYIAQHYPQFSWLTQNPEVMNLFRQAQANNWSPQKFSLEMQKTNWWRTTADTTRSWEALKATDPAKAERVLRQQRGVLSDQAIRLGVDLDPNTLGTLAENALRFGWAPGEVDDALVNYVSWGNLSGGGLAAGAMQQVKKMQGDYVVRLSDGESQTWARRLLSGEATPESMRAYFVEQSKSLFPSLTRALDSGLTVRQYADPYIQLAADALETTPESIDLNDPKWSRPLMQVDKDGNRVQMSLYDWGKTVRSDPTYGWTKTKQAQDKADALTLGLARTFGKIA